MRIQIVTTANKKGFDDHGRRMVDTFVRFWPESAHLAFYTEGYNFTPPAANIETRPLPEWFEVWKEEHRTHADAHGRAREHNRQNRKYDFRRDCVRFAHKVAAVTDAAADDCDLLIWCDSDVITHAPVTEEWLCGLFRKADYMAWLDRSGMYPECGFLMFNPRHAQHTEFMSAMRRIYESGRVFELKETHDSYVWQHVAGGFAASGAFKQPASLSGRRARDFARHPFVRSPLGEKMDHLKGYRKGLGKSPHSEAGRYRREKYWRRAG